MATPLQPMLSPASGSTVGSTARPSLNFSGVGQLANSLLQPAPTPQGTGSDLSERRFQYQMERDAKGDFEDSVKAGVFSQLLEHRDAQNQLALRGTRVDQMREMLANNPNIAENDREFGKQFVDQFEAYQEARSTGFGNEAYFNTKINNVLKQAAVRAPGIADDLYKMATGELADFSGDIGPTKEQVAAHNQMVQEFGHFYTPQDVTTFKNRQQRLASLEEKKALGDVSSMNLLLTVPEKFQTLTDGTMRNAWTTYKEFGGLSDEQITDYKQALSNDLAFSKQFVREAMMNQSARTGAQFDPEQLNQIFSQLEDQHSKLAGMFDEKDMASRLELHNKLQTEVFTSQYWGLINIAEQAEALGGLPGKQGLLNAMGDENLKEILVNSGMGYLDNLGFSKEELTAQLYNLMMTEFDPQDEGLRRAVATMSASTLKNQPLEQAGTQFTDYMDWLSRDDDGTIIPGNAITASDMLLSMRGPEKTNYRDTLENNKSNQTMFRNMARSWLDLAVADAQEQLGTADIAYNPRTEQFQSITTLRSPDPVSVGVEVNPNIARDQLQEQGNTRADLLNNLMAIAKDPVLGQYFMDPQELKKFVETSMVVGRANREEPEAPTED